MTSRVSFPIELKGVKEFYIEGLEKGPPLVLFTDWKETVWSPTSPGSVSGPRVGDSLLLFAYTGDVNSGQEAIQKGADVRAQDDQGICPLMVACQEGHTPFVKLLIEQGAIITQQTHSGRTPLFYAVVHNRQDLARLLLKSDPELLQMVDEDGMTVLMACVLNSLFDMLVLLHEFQADFNIQDKYGRTALMAAAQLGNLEMVTYLVQNGAVTSTQCNTGATALLITLSRSHFPLVEFLMNETDINLPDHSGNSVLLISCCEGLTDIVKRALELRADVNQKSKNGITPIMAAVYQGTMDIVRSLMRHKPDLTLKNDFGLTAYDMAILWKRTDIINHLRGFQDVERSKSESDILQINKILPILVLLRNEKYIKKFMKDKYILPVNEFCNDHTPLMMAVHQGHLGTVQILLENGAQVNIQSPEGATALTIAIAKDHVAVLERLLEYGADINLVDNKGETMLFKCAAEGNIEGLLKLERMGANIDKRNNEGNTPLMAAAQNGHVDIVKYLWKVCAQLDTKNLDGCTACDIALLYDQHEVAALLHDKHDDVFEDESSHGQMLMQACLRVESDYVLHILANGAPVNYRDPSHQLRTPLMCAAQAGDRDIVEILLKHGASVYLKSSEYEVPIIFAALNGHTEVVKCLINNGANLNVTDAEGHTPLMCACQNGYFGIVKEMVKQGALICTKDVTGTSALIFAAQQGHADIVEVLLETGLAHVETMDCQRRTPLFLSCYMDNIEAVRILLKHNADIDSQVNEKHKTPLMAAVEGNNLAIVQLLVENGASLEKVDHHGNCAHEIADGKYLTDIHAYLVEKLAEQRANRPLSTGTTLGTKKTALQSSAKTKTKLEGEKNLLDMCGNDWGFEDSVKYTIEAGADVDCTDADGLTPVLISAKKGHFKYIPWLVKYGADVNRQDELGCTALMYALMREEYAVVIVLLEGAGSGSLCNVDIQDYMGTTALMIAIQLAMYEVAASILELTQDANLADKDRNTALFHCAMDPNIEPTLLYLLLEKQAQTNRTNSHGDTPLLLALRHGNKALVQILLEQNIDLVHQNHLQEDALIVTCLSDCPSLMHLVAPYQDWFEIESFERAIKLLVMNGNTELLNILLIHGLEVNRTYENHDTLAFLAVRYDNNWTLDECLERGANVDHQNDEGDTILMLACERGDVHMVKRIILHGADLCVRNKQGLTALDIATAENHPQPVQLIREKLPGSTTSPGCKLILCDTKPCQSGTLQAGSRSSSTTSFFDLEIPDSPTETDDFLDFSTTDSFIEIQQDEFREITSPSEITLGGAEADQHPLVQSRGVESDQPLLLQSRTLEQHFPEIQNSDFIEDFYDGEDSDSCRSSNMEQSPQENETADFQAESMRNESEAEKCSSSGVLATETVREGSRGQVAERVQNVNTGTEERPGVEESQQVDGMGSKKTEDDRLLLSQLKQDLEAKERLIDRKNDQLTACDTQLAILREQIQVSEVQVNRSEAKQEMHHETECAMKHETVRQELGGLRQKVHEVEKMTRETMSENEVLKLQQLEAAEQEKALKEELEFLQMELKARDETIETLQRVLKQQGGEGERGEIQNDARLTRPSDDKLDKWQICACKREDCPTCVAENAATATPQPGIDGAPYWDDTDPDDTRHIEVFSEVKPDIPGYSRKFIYLFHMSIADHSHTDCCASSISALLFAHRHLTNPCPLYGDHLSDILYNQVSGSIQDAKQVLELNYSGRKTQLLPSDTVLVNSHVGVLLKEEVELDSLVEETLLHYMMNMEDSQILLFYRMAPYKVFSIFPVEASSKLLVLDPQLHSVKRRTQEIHWYGAFLFSSERDVTVIKQTIQLLILYGGPLSGKCRLAVVERLNT